MENYRKTVKSCTRPLKSLNNPFTLTLIVVAYLVVFLRFFCWSQLGIPRNIFGENWLKLFRLPSQTSLNSRTSKNLGKNKVVETGFFRKTGKVNDYFHVSIKAKFNAFDWSLTWTGGAGGGTSPARRPVFLFVPFLFFFASDSRRMAAVASLTWRAARLCLSLQCYQNPTEIPSSGCRTRSRRRRRSRDINMK